MQLYCGHIVSRILFHRPNVLRCNAKCLPVFWHFRSPQKPSEFASIPFVDRGHTRAEQRRPANIPIRFGNFGANRAAACIKVQFTRTPPEPFLAARLLLSTHVLLFKYHIGRPWKFRAVWLLVSSRICRQLKHDFVSINCYTGRWYTKRNI